MGKSESDDEGGPTTNALSKIPNKINKFHTETQPQYGSKMDLGMSKSDMDEFNTSQNISDKNKAMSAYKLKKMQQHQIIGQPPKEPGKRGRKRLVPPQDLDNMFHHESKKRDTGGIPILNESYRQNNDN